MQVVLVYLEWCRRNSLLKCVLQPNIAKNSLKPLFWGFKAYITDRGLSVVDFENICEQRAAEKLQIKR